jgi:hypothetical protein
MRPIALFRHDLIDVRWPRPKDWSKEGIYAVCKGIRPPSERAHLYQRINTSDKPMYEVSEQPHTEKQQDIVR